MSVSLLKTKIDGFCKNYIEIVLGHKCKSNRSNIEFLFLKNIRWKHLETNYNLIESQNFQKKFYEYSLLGMEQVEHLNYEYELKVQNTILRSIFSKTRKNLANTF